MHNVFFHTYFFIHFCLLCLAYAFPHVLSEAMRLWYSVHESSGPTILKRLEESKRKFDASVQEENTKRFASFRIKDEEEEKEDYDEAMAKFKRLEIAYQEVTDENRQLKIEVQTLKLEIQQLKFMDLTQDY